MIWSNHQFEVSCFKNRPLLFYSEIFPPLLGCHQEFLVGNMRRRRPFSFKGQLEVGDDAVDDLRFVLFSTGVVVTSSGATPDLFLKYSSAKAGSDLSLSISSWRS